ncbi:Purine-cytosine permease FCY22 [Tolypocladium paradoxum]|uniref:Purine-cytosine permease FCY22 n=1 Tax=Tolypocladium paradoxum TaxID=94208 RepID=A0A2S4KNF4_9HYPO|nr:Purine-cytosine permease FCY22 [Tolypocladium paradoxum]
MAVGQQPSRQLCSPPWASSGRSSERSRTLLGDPPWCPSSWSDEFLCWPLTGDGHGHVAAAGLDCFGAAFPEQPDTRCRQPGPHDNDDNSADASPGPQLQQPLLDDADVALLGLFGTVPSGNGMEPNDDHRHNHQHHDVFPQDHGALMGSSLHDGISHHNHHHHGQQDHITLQDALDATQERTTTHTTNHPYFPPIAESSSTSTATPASSTMLNLPPPRRGHHGSLPASSTGSKRKQPASPDANADGHDEVAIKRQRNTMAARKYRQKRLDRIADLERALEDVTGERDDLRLQLARREAEVDALREMLARK